MTTATEVNVDLLVDALAHIEVYPERYNQGDWADVAGSPTVSEHPAKPTACETSFCVAGWIAALGVEGEVLYDTYNDVQGTKHWMATSGWRLPDGNVRSISGVAREALGARLGDAEDLFNGDNSLDEVYGHAARIAGLAIDDLEAKVSARVEIVRAQREERTNRDNNS